MNDTAARHPNRFLADLTRAMHSTAEMARQATIEQCRADAKTYTEKLHARTDDEAAALRQAAETDVSAIGDWAKAEVERIRVEMEERIARRRELLEREIQEYSATIEVETERVEKRAADFEEEVALFFEQLLQEADTTVFASMAARMPDPPSFDIGGEPDSMTPDISAQREQIMGATEPLPNSDATQAEAEAAEAAVERTAASGPATVESTRVVVVGLVSVASIATFKRQLGRLAGVKNVGVSSGPDGEFIFTVGHGSDIYLSDLITTLPAFQARVVSEGDGVLNVSARDPEADG